MSKALRQALKTHRDRMYTGWPDFDRLVQLRPDLLVNVFSTPGIGKSFFALNLAKRVTDPRYNRHPKGVLYITLDTPLRTQAERWNALHAEKPIGRTPSVYTAMTDRKRKGHGWLEWSDIGMDVSQLPDLMKGVKEYTGTLPGLVIVDVVKDLLKEGSYEELSIVFKELKEIAMQARVLVMSLHHATKSNDPSKKLSLRDVEYTGDKQPDVVLGMYSRDEVSPTVSVLKNRSGLGSPDGNVKMRFRWDWSRGGDLYQPQHRETPWGL